MRPSFHSELIARGFKVGEDDVYRALVRIADGAEEDQVVLAVFPHSGGVTVYASCGMASDTNQDALSFARSDGDNCGVEVLGPLMLLSRSVALNERESPADTVCAVAGWLGPYAREVQHRVQDYGRERRELIERWDERQSAANSHRVSDGTVPLATVIAETQRILELVPQKALWETMLASASSAALRAWSSGRSPSLAEEPWSKLAQWLRDYGQEVGWEAGAK